MACFQKFRFRNATTLGACLLAVAAAAPRAFCDDPHPKIDPSQGWQSLFNGQDLSGWELKPNKPGAWVVEEGALARKGAAYLWSVEKFGDFVLDLEFKVAPEANSGVIVRHIFDPNARSYWWNGLLEVQVLDSHGRSEPSKHDCGALYDMVAPAKNSVKPAGQWNRMTITALGPKITVVMNCVKIVDINLDDWPEPGKNPDGTPNKYHKAMKDLQRNGHILLQDHGKPVWYRNLHIKRLDG